MRKRQPLKSVESSKTRKQVDEDSWHDALEAVSINDDEWWCMVTMMVETIIDHSRCVSVFNAGAEEGKRKAVYALSRRKVLDSVRVLSNQNPDKCPTIQGVCHYASKVLNEDNGELPSWLMAQVIKYLICRAKEENIGIVKKMADLEREIDREYLIMQTVADWGQPTSKDFDPEGFNFKANTKLRKRNEEWRHTVFVDDTPINGPNLYVILTGFHDPDLPKYLLDAGVPLTCILAIKRPNEQLDRTFEQEPLGSSTKKKLQFLQSYNADRLDLLNFWTMIEKRSMDPENHPEYCDVAFLTFDPPELPITFDKDEYEATKKSMFDSVSYFVYDIYDLHRQHSNYLKCMKVETNIAEVTKMRYSTNVYETFLSKIPPECVSTPLILLGMLLQIEESEGRRSVKKLVDEKDDVSRIEVLETVINLESIDELATQSLADVVQQKLDALDVKYDLYDGLMFNSNEQRPTEIELIHGDPLTEVVRLMRDATSVSILLDNILPIFWHPIVACLHSQPSIPEKKRNEYRRHIDEARRYFDIDISHEEARHYLHILMFDRMVCGRYRPGTGRNVFTEVGGSMINLKSSTDSLQRSKSVPSLTSKHEQEIHFRSDGNIDYGKVVPTVLECAPLFDLIDPREALTPGYLMDNLYKRRDEEEERILRLEDFNEVEFLSRTVFLQLLHQCLQSFDVQKTLYFEPTDTLLLYFGQNPLIDSAYQEESVSNIRTPVCFRDFTEYVVDEEQDWLRREEEQYAQQTNQALERLMKRSAEMFDEATLFRDEDFILPGSLKARDLEKRLEMVKRKPNLQLESSSVDETEKSSKMKSKSKDNIKSKKGSEKKKKRLSDKALTEKASSKSFPEIQSASTAKYTVSYDKFEKELDYEFIGYDLGRLRVQVKNIQRTFRSADDTLVQVEIDDWLYKNKDLRITVTACGYSLRLFHRINDGGNETSKIFHLTSRTGIILAFEKSLISPYEEAYPRQGYWRHATVDFKASWPTGLLIEPINGTGPDNPFYIRQSYATSNGYGYSDGVRELCRKFLRNGTVLKYLVDGRIIVLRPNGVIVNCTAFESRQFKEPDIYNDDSVTIPKGNRSSSATKSFKSKRKSSSLVRSQTSKANEDPRIRSQGTAMNQSPDSVLSVDDKPIKVLRYTVLDHDGRWYEVADDFVVSEHHRLLVRTASDYEVDEKFTRRADGTNMLLNSDGQLIVEYPDGTLITTGYIIEDETIRCDWSDEEIPRYFTSDETKGEVNYADGVSFSNLKFLDESSSRRSLEYGEDVARLSIDDDFVSVQLTCRVEHKNYATVYYDQSTVSCTLSMPDQLRVSISERGHYEVSMADGVNLKIKEDGLTLKGNSCTICGNQSTSVYNFYLFESPTVIFSTVDVFENTFEVNDDGTTSYRRKGMTDCRVSSSSEDVLQPNDDRENYKYHGLDGICHDKDECCELVCDHERLRIQPDDFHCRIFSLNRNLTAYEYLHRSVSNQAELATAFDNETSMILYRGSRRPKLRHLVILEPLKSESRSKTVLTFQHPELKPTNYDRRQILRSTYSIPYNWLFPFGRNGNGIRDNTHHLPLMSGINQKPPELLQSQILRSFKEPDVNPIIDLQRALGLYWITLASGGEPSTRKRSEMKGSLVKGTRASIYERLENNLHDLVFGIARTIDVETYMIGLNRRGDVSKARISVKSSKFHRLLVETALNKEEFDWYRRCKKDGYILPYFENVVGTCFLWVNECVEKAVAISRENKAIARKKLLALYESGAA